MGYHTTEEAAAQANNVEAGRLGLALNVIPPVGAAGAGAGPGAGARAIAGASAGRKRAAPATAASQKTKKVKLADTSSAAAGAASAAGSAGAGGVMRVTPAQWAKLDARVYAFQNRGKGYS